MLAWIRAGWWRWEEEKPEWFTDNWKTHVPKYMFSEKGSEEVVAVEREEKKDHEGGVIDAQEFKREMERRGSINL
ncbi:hypothetical protein TrLO_g14654 [Triparma laevis f. longispina]|uniref:Uncharacterized protein n=1 Tax=Triparma laevis f. longispina TaxID=1714387 RepID=A0A9W7FSX9_9STRA|nr:hypothetical protein TrLO_g14654 [Triparma laevis f. longispina]